MQKFLGKRHLKRQIPPFMVAQAGAVQPYIGMVADRPEHQESDLSRAKHRRIKPPLIDRNARGLAQIGELRLPGHRNLGLAQRAIAMAELPNSVE